MTAENNGCFLSKIYVKPQLREKVTLIAKRCFLSKIYVKPQLVISWYLVLFRCFLSKIYVKPQLHKVTTSEGLGVSYQKSTSNHNCTCHEYCYTNGVSYQKSTSNHNYFGSKKEFRAGVSYQKSTSNHNIPLFSIIFVFGCFLSKIYVKPQLSIKMRHIHTGVSYQKSTSNHNYILSY